MKTFLLSTLAVGLAVTFARAGDPPADWLDNWPHWRGPEATGMAPHGDPPVKWDAQTNIKWKTPIPGRGSATPIIWKDQIYVVTALDTGRQADPKDIPNPDPAFEVKTKPPTTYYQFLVLSLDRQTGKVRWQRTAAEKVPHEGHHPTHSYAAGSPVTDGRRLYVSFGSFGLYCYDLDGKLLWQRDLGRLHTRLGWGEASTPAIHGDTLVVNWDQEKSSYVIALDAATGKTRWQVDRDEVTSWATPLVVEYQGRTQVIVSATNRVRSYDLATGALLWQCGGQTVNVIPSPVTDGRYVYCVSGYKGSAAIAIPLDATGDITGSSKVVWHYDKATPYVPSPLLAGDRLYFTQLNDPLLTSLDTKTGKPVIDRARLPDLSTLYASPAGAADRIYIVDREGTTLVLKRGDQVEVLAVNRLDDPIDASPAIVGKQLFLRGEKFLYCIEAP
jgi:outer membrane protein assembly factor BamB